MSLRRAVALLLTTVTMTTTLGCGVRELPAPAPPRQVVPDVPDLPDKAPPDGMGRLLIENEGEPAKVARVTESIQPATLSAVGTPASHPTWSPSGNKTELLCITPCAVDMKTGAQTLVFTSPRDPEKTSSADVPVPRGTSVVRHALGRQKPYNMGYAGGALATFGGAGMTLIGGLTLAVGLTGAPKLDEAGRPTNSGDGFTVMGAVVGTVGLAALVTGIVFMTSNRPEKSPGATTIFRLPN